MSESILSSSQKAQFERDGYLVVPGFCSTAQCAELLDRARHLLDDFSLDGHPRTKFSTGATSDHVGDSYFLESGNAVRYFFEEGAFDEDGEFREGVTKASSINKIGHGLHALDPIYRKFTLENPRLKTLARELGQHKDPRVLQSMVICKQPKIGGEVPIHNDSTFLYTDPVSAVGFWFALEPCTKTNGCLWFVPGSHKTVPIRKRFVRSPEGSGTTFEALDAPGESESWTDSDFVAEPCDAGSLVIIHGSVVHKSAHNHSDRSRLIYTFHMIESEEQGAKYDEKNWLQPSKEMPFSRLFAAA